MRLAIVSGGQGWHVQDLLRAAAELSLRVDVLDFRSLHAGVGFPSAPPPRPLSQYQAALIRTMPAGSLEQIIFRMDWLHAAMQTGVRVVNPPRTLEVCIDKYLTCVRLATAGIPTPPTIVAQRTEEALRGFAELGGDVVVKPLFGAEGRGLQRLSDPELAWRTFRILETTAQVIYLQKFIPHRGYDVRVFVLGNQILAAMQRKARTGEWRTNVAQGGRTAPIQLDAHLADLARQAAYALECPIAGVDLLPGQDGRWWVVEVNAVPGWKALATTCQIDVAKHVWHFLCSQR
ncbi:MAG: RimK family alpha-L-glutamate ligase [Gemmataceae bacterium]|nr:RimK family alpha-L-glutamate ligase [Gemmataceae bacterium]MCS7271082.1 RimK family alpha-L-glutamate ligase [Gemmataceae bacterium]MDW8241788.1 RimK family alpha-L-glutamate ligase [Thermogemmata sp.]